jgi:hypothetical protein
MDQFHPAAEHVHSLIPPYRQNPTLALGFEVLNRKGQSLIRGPVEAVGELEGVGIGEIEIASNAAGGDASAGGGGIGDYKKIRGGQKERFWKKRKRLMDIR